MCLVLLPNFVSIKNQGLLDSLSVTRYISAWNNELFTGQVCVQFNSMHDVDRLMAARKDEASFVVID